MTSKANEIKDAELVKDIKPKLKKYLIDTQVKNAEKVSKEKKKENEQLLSNEQIAERMFQLSKIAFFELRVWVDSPPALDMPWLRDGSGRPEFQADMNLDLGGFATYLLREYYGNYLPLKDKDYPNPLLEENLKFFWDKMNVDLRLLFKADLINQKKGNKGAVMLNKDEIQ
jgi:hypothetical protein